MYILDSAVIIDIMKSKETADEVTKIVGESRLGTTAFSIFEVSIGLTEKERKIADDFFSNLEIAEFNHGASLESVKIEKYLTKTGKKINLVDVFIAGICIANNCTLITSDKGFEKIKGLEKKII